MAAARGAKRKAPNGTVTAEIVTTILAGVASGKSLRAASADIGLAVSTVLEAIDRLGMSEQYAHARAERADVLVEEMLEIADSKTGSPKRDRLRLDARKWFASKLNPRRYGDKIAIGGDPDAPPVALAYDVRFGGDGD